MISVALIISNHSADATGPRGSVMPAWRQEASSNAMAGTRPWNTRQPRGSRGFCLAERLAVPEFIGISLAD
ncbi:MAG TPA: hypothetical protein VME45_15135 [Stellaceae bacterium]|nr:hypothetical protein [Stellaceae bacterium]